MSDCGCFGGKGGAERLQRDGDGNGQEPTFNDRRERFRRETDQIVNRIGEMDQLLDHLKTAIEKVRHEIDQARKHNGRNSDQRRV